MLDIIVLLVFAVFIYWGYKRGLMSEIWSVIGVGVALFIAKWQASYFALMIDQKKNIFALIISFVLVFILVISLTEILIKVFKKFLKKIHVKKLDNALGGAVGFVKAFVINIVIISLFFTLSMVNKDIKKMNETSVSYGIARNMASFAVNNFVDEDIRNVLKSKIEKQ